MKAEINLSRDISTVDWERVQDLFVAVGWGERNVSEIEIAFRRSTHKVFAFFDGRLIGFGRTVDDGINYALICDLVIAPEYQNRGIGSRILSELRIACDGFRFLTLTAAEGKDDFYLKQGWKRQTTSFIWPRNDEQARIHS